MSERKGYLLSRPATISQVPPPGPTHATQPSTIQSKWFAQLWPRGGFFKFLPTTPEQFRVNQILLIFVRGLFLAEFYRRCKSCAGQYTTTNRPRQHTFGAEAGRKKSHSPIVVASGRWARRRMNQCHVCHTPSIPFDTGRGFFFDGDIFYRRRRTRFRSEFFASSDDIFLGNESVSRSA